MNKIKVIDLLNMISKGEEVPKKIRINGYIYKYQGDDYLFIDKNNDNHKYWLFSEGYTDKFQWLENFLRTEIEILEEEKKIPEKIDLTGYWDKNSLRTEEWCSSEELIGVKINELIDYLESKEKGDE